MLRIILLICSFVLPIIADEAKKNSFLDTGGVELPRIGSAQSSITSSQDLSKNLVIPTISDHKSETKESVVPDSKLLTPPSSSLKPDIIKIDNKAPGSSVLTEKPKDNANADIKPVPSVDSKTASKPSTKLPLPEADGIKPPSQVTTVAKPEAQNVPTVNPVVPNLPLPGPRNRSSLTIPTLPPPGPKTNSKPLQVETAQQLPDKKLEAPDVSKKPTVPTSSQMASGVHDNHEISKVQTQASNINQQSQKPDTSTVRPVKTPISKPEGWTLKDKIQSYSVVKKPVEQKRAPYTFKPKSAQTAKVKKPAWSFKKIWSFKKKQDIKDTQHASKGESKKSAWSFKKIWSFKKSGEVKSEAPIDLIPVEPVIQEAKSPKKNMTQPAYVIKPKKIQIASNTKAYSVKEKDHDLKEKQVHNFVEQELKIVKAKDYDDSLTLLSYNEYTKLFWSKFSTRGEKERDVDVKSYLDNYYKYQLDKKTKRRN